MENIKVIRQRRTELEEKINYLIDSFYKDNLRGSSATVILSGTQPVVNEDLKIGRRFKSVVKLEF